MNKVEKKRVAGKGSPGEDVQLGLPGVFRQGLREVIFDQGMQAVLAMLEECARPAQGGSSPA